MEMCDQVNYDEKGLVPAIIQDHENGEVLMIAYMNKESLRRTIETGRTHFWSRSRQAFWEKGEHSGHVQVVKEVRIDCDNDAVLIKVDQKVAACHAGYRSCFYRKWESEGWSITMKKIFDETQVY